MEEKDEHDEPIEEGVATIANSVDGGSAPLTGFSTLVCQQRDLKLTISSLSGHATERGACLLICRFCIDAALLEVLPPKG